MPEHLIEVLVDRAEYAVGIGGLHSAEVRFPSADARLPDIRRDRLQARDQTRLVLELEVQVHSGFQVVDFGAEAVELLHETPIFRSEIPGGDTVVDPARAGGHEHDRGDDNRNDGNEHAESEDARHAYRLHSRLGSAYPQKIEIAVHLISTP